MHKCGDQREHLPAAGQCDIAQMPTLRHQGSANSWEAPALCRFLQPWRDFERERAQSNAKKSCKGALQLLYNLCGHLGGLVCSLHSCSLVVIQSMLLAAFLCHTQKNKSGLAVI